VALARVELRLGQRQRAEGVVKAFRQGGERRTGFLELAALDLLQRGLVAAGSLHPRDFALLLPPLPAVDQAEAEGDATEDAERVLAQPGANAFALFVFVKEFVDCHAAAMLPVARRMSRPVGDGSAPTPSSV